MKNPLFLLPMLLLAALPAQAQVFFSHDTVCAAACLHSDVYLYNKTPNTVIIDSIYARKDTAHFVTGQALIIAMFPSNCYMGTYLVSFMDDYTRFSVCDSPFLEIPPGDSVIMRFEASSCISCKERMTDLSNAIGDTIIIDLFFFAQGVLLDSLKYVDIDYGGAIEGPDAANEADIISVYPNPSNAAVKIRYSTGPSHRGAIKIFNLSGGLIYAEPVNGTGYAGWNASGLAAGVYLLKAEIGNRRFHRKLLVQK